ncbi:MAG: amidase family protein [Gelidibacter sp.]
MKLLLICITILFTFSCKNSEEKPKIQKTAPSNIEIIVDTTVLSSISEKDFRDFKVLDSDNLTKMEIWETINSQMEDFTESDYERLKPLVLEKDITQLQIQRTVNYFTYEELTKFYLYRIRKFDRENSISLNSVISINPNVIKEARSRDQEFLHKLMKHPIHGMPILLKDNVNALDMATTSGAVAFQDNITDDAFIVKQLKSKGALVLGKANLSEWAYFFCDDCPSGYSAIGGQTLNPYGRKTIDTGGSSSGSGVAVAANFCVAAIGTETSGSILSPSSQNSIVGLKPTIGLLSRSGIVPISSTLDTPGPMAKNVTDTAIVLDAMLGYDEKDSKSVTPKLGNITFYDANLKKTNLEGKRFGAFKELMKDSLYVRGIADLKTKGAIIVEIEEEKLELPDFLRLLNLDMQNDLPNYIKISGDPNLTVNSVADVMSFNKKDSIGRMPYGQSLFAGIVADSATDEEFDGIKNTLKSNGRLFFDTPMKKHNLDGILSINNFHASFAAVAEYPAITVPMGYSEIGEPEGLTFIGKPYSEKLLLGWAYTYEQASKRRIPPKNYN